MKFIVDNDITIIDADQNVKKWCGDNLILDNPDYYKKQRLGKWVGNTPSEIWLFENQGEEIHVPFGCMRSLWGLYPNKDMWKSSISPIQPRKYTSHINLYDYQKEAVEAALKQRNGVLVMPCGSGKTQCGIDWRTSIMAYTYSGLIKSVYEES